MRPEPAPPRGLLEVQVFLTHALQRAEPLADDPDLARACADVAAGNDRLTPAEQVDIYRRQFWLRHEDSLREDFPGLAYVLGDALFEDLVRDYLRAHPPSSASLRDLGHAMSAFLAVHTALPAERADLARAMARYELAFIDVFDLAEPPPLDSARLAALRPEDWERAVLVLSPVVQRLTLSHPVHHLRKAVRTGETPPLPAPGEVHVALFRKDLVVHFEELEPAQQALLDALDAGAPLAAACARVADGKTEEEAGALAASIGTWFSRWASWGFIAEVRVPAAGPP